MKITPSIRKAHERLGMQSTRFLEYAGQNPGVLKADSYRGLALNDEMFHLQSWPTFVNRQTLAEMKDAAVKTVRLIESIPGRIYGGDTETLCRHYGISTGLARYFFDGYRDEDLYNLLARGDFVFSESGPKCLEFNINTNLGGLQLPLWESLYLNIPVIADFIRKNNVPVYNVNLYSILFGHLLGTARNGFPGEGEINIAVVFPASFEANVLHAQTGYYNRVYKALLKKENLAGEVTVCNYEGLKAKNRYLYHKGKKIHSLLEWDQGFVPAEILEIFKERNILIYNGPASALLSSKLNLALLSELEDSENLGSEERESIKKYIPWTRKVKSGESTYESGKIEMESFIIANREKLVLKPLVGYGGKGIHVGRYTPAAEWQKRVEAALQGEDLSDWQVGETVSAAEWYRFIHRAVSLKSWVVQEYVESPPYLYQWGEDGCAEHNAIWGYYVFGGHYAGGCVRVLPKVRGKGIVSGHQGAKVSALFEVDV